MKAAYGILRRYVRNVAYRYDGTLFEMRACLRTSSLRLHLCYDLSSDTARLYTGFEEKSSCYFLLASGYREKACEEEKASTIEKSVPLS
jgi:hypothetical protein